MLEIIGLILVGLAAGTLSGLLGIGGAILIIPALVFIFGFDQKMAQGTSLMLMVPPIGILAALTYYKQELVDLRAAIIIAAFFFLGGFIGAKLSLTIDNNILKKVFAVFLVLVAIKMWFDK